MKSNKTVDWSKIGETVEASEISRQKYTTGGKWKKDEIIEKVKELDSVKLAKKNRELKLTVKQLQSEISSLRKQMISINKELQEQDKNPAFTRDDYQYLSKLKKELKADTMQDVYNQVMQLKQKVRNKSKNFGIDM